MSRYTYCPKCNHDVEAFEVSEGTRGEKASLKCSQCGTKLADLSTVPEAPARAAAAHPAAVSSPVVMAGYNGLQNDIITAALMRGKYCDKMEYTANGEEFLAKISSLLHERHRPKLIIIEANMSIMNGINAALCMRSIEKGVGREKTPILFLTTKPLDEMFTRAIKFLTPAKYVPLPPNPDVNSFRARVEQVVELLHREKW